MFKRVFITGAGTGIGRDASIELARRGHNVIASTHYEEEARLINEYAKDKGLEDNLKGIKLNVTLEEDRKKILNYDIDVLINNAAIGDSGSVMEVNVSRYRKTYETNVIAPIELTQLVLINMVKNKEGRIIFVSSLLGRISKGFFSPYTSTKFAIEAIAESLIDELVLLKDCNIDVAIIEPGAYKTGFNQLMMERKYNWMKEKSYFKHIVNKIRIAEQGYFSKVENISTESIVKEYIKAVEDKESNKRYIAPKYQGLVFQSMRIVGK